MFRKYSYIVSALLLIVFQTNAQIRPGGSGTSRQQGSEMNTGEESGTPSKEGAEKEKPKIPSVIKTWKIKDQGTSIRETELDTSLTFYHNYLPFNKNSISSTFTGNNGGAYLSNDFFKRQPNSDFYFTRAFDAYGLTPSQINYFNTTTPYSLMDYTQSENRSAKNETRFNFFFSQNVNKKLNFGFIYNQTRSQGHYAYQENKFHNLALVSSYLSDRFLSHSNIIFNRLEGQENGGIDAGQSFTGTKTTDLTTQLEDARSKLQNNNIFTTNEYRMGKTVESEADTSGYVAKTFIPRVGFIHEFEYSDNKRIFTNDKPSTSYYFNPEFTYDSVKYSRLTNIFQIKAYEAPDRKFTFGKRAYIGHDELRYHTSTRWNQMDLKDASSPEKLATTYVGGGIFRNEGKFWQWEADGRIYLAGYRAGQTELNGFINKPLKIGRDTASLRIESSLKSLVPDYFDNNFLSNQQIWKNNFDNINEMTVRSSIHSQAYKTTIGVNYSLFGNYIYNNKEALPAQAGSELLILSAYLNKDIDRKHWIIRTQLLVQKANNDNYIHLPAFAGYISMNYRTVISKVMYTQIGFDTRYNSVFYADAWDPESARFYLQDKQRIGNYPYIDAHVNLKLKRTRFFFILMNAASGLAGDNYFMAPDYPYYRRTFRVGIAWSFYD